MTFQPRDDLFMKHPNCPVELRRKSAIIAAGHGRAMIRAAMSLNINLTKHQRAKIKVLLDESDAADKAYKEKYSKTKQARKI